MGINVNVEVSPEYQKRILKIMASLNSQELVKKELDKSQLWFTPEVFKELLDWAISELAEFASQIKEWFFGFFMKPIQA